MNKIIALDIGGVCLKLEPDKAMKYFGYEKLSDIPPELMPVVGRYERGLAAERELLDVLRNGSGRDFSDDELRYGWNLIIGDVVNGMEDLIREFAFDGFRFVFFSDTGPLHMMEVYRKLPFAHLVCGAILSYEVGAKKPEPEMYQAFESKYGKPFLYIDDRLENIEGGITAGWDSHLFSSVQALREQICAKVGVFSR